MSTDWQFGIELIRGECSRKLLFDMIEIEEIGGGLRVVDAAKNEMEIEIEGWEPGGEELEISRFVEGRTTGSAKRVVVPGQSVTVESAKRDQWRRIEFDEERKIAADNHLIQIDSVLCVFLCMTSDFSIFVDSGEDCTIIDFPEVTNLTIGFRRQYDFPTDILRIPPTSEGVARALTEFGMHHRTDSPDRSYPSMRLHPPLVKFDESVSPDEAEINTDRSIVINVPPRFQVLYSVAPFAYYLGASVEIDASDTITLATDTMEHRFSDIELFPQEVMNMLSRVFYLDCLVRNAGPFHFDLQELDLLDKIPLDPDTIYSMPMEERLVEYLSTPYGIVASEFPDWPLAVCMTPSIENAQTIPHLLNRLSLIFPPEATLLDEQTIMDRSLGDFYRSTDNASLVIQKEQILDPVSQHAAVQGWIADGTTVDAFKCLPEAFSNRLTYLGQDSPLSIAVILNSEAMGAEYSEVVNVYRDGSSAYPIDVDVRRCLSRSEFAETFRTTYDFVHYIGHCDPNGIRCEDGNISTSALQENRVQSFFLNACGSYVEGLDLIRKGSVAGAVTIGDVLDEQAKKVGKTFAKLFVRGYNLFQSLHLSRNRAIMNRQYTVVGDGTFTPASSTHISKFTLVISKIDEGLYQVRSDHLSPNMHGSVFQATVAPRPTLVGNANGCNITENQLYRYLSKADHPIIYEDRLYWPDELLEELT